MSGKPILKTGTMLGELTLPDTRGEQFKTGLTLLYATYHSPLHTANDDVVDRDEYELNGVADQAHYCKADSTARGDFFEFLRVRFSASLDKSP